MLVAVALMLTVVPEMPMALPTNGYVVLRLVACTSGAPEMLTLKSSITRGSGFGERAVKTSRPSAFMRGSETRANADSLPLDVIQVSVVSTPVLPRWPRPAQEDTSVRAPKRPDDTPSTPAAGPIQAASAPAGITMK